ncbi:Fe2+-dependent dioxygenase, partial [Ectopseudomonas khazarica]
PLKVVPPRFNRYAGGGQYGDHIDNAIFSVPGTSQRIRADLSATLFFNEPDEYDGGELVTRERRIKLPAGHLVLYSSGSLHRVEPVTRGARLASFFWLQSLVRQDDQRELLLELDDSIQALRLQVPDSPELLRLTGLYHNLLRQWSQT